MNLLSYLNPARRSIPLASALSFLLLAATPSLRVQAQQTAALPDGPGFVNQGGFVFTAEDGTAPSYSSSAPFRAIGPNGQGTATPYQTPTGGDGGGKQTKRILGLIPNFHSVSADQHLPPETVKQKFIEATEDSFDYSSILLPAIVAAYNDADKQTPEFHHGAAAYGRYFWHSFVDQTDENYWVEFIIPAIAHQDTRYYTLGHGGKQKRTIYALKHIIITRSDSGKTIFNSGEVVGAGISSFLSNLYYPTPERTAGNTFSQFGLDLGIDAFTFVFKEFWPDINNHLFHLKDE